ncbi:MAG: alpha/beta hydrolase [Cyanobacteria bacterium SW_9_44_58]|nr:MAG: alpha/beta hydrolase [Cyanobacteria bacterium SW_9_44_58]
MADLEALCDASGWQSAHILGHSWSAKVITYWAQQHPQRFRSMILVDPFFMGKFPSWFRIAFPILYRTLSTLKGMGPFETYQQAETQARRLGKYQAWNPLQQKVFQANLERKSDGRWGSKFTVAARNGIFKEVMEVEGLSQRLTIPTLLITPKKGLNRTKWQLQPYQKCLPNLEIATMPGNHWAFLQAPEAFNQTVAQFLAKYKHS